MVSPRWSIDQDCKDCAFGIDGVISLNTANLHEKWLDWRDYGGPLAIFRFGRFVLERLLGAPIDPDRRMPSFPVLECYQQGRLILRRVDQIPEGATLVQTAGAGETLDLGDGHLLGLPHQPGHPRTTFAVVLVHPRRCPD